MSVAALLTWAAAIRAPGLRVPPPVAYLAAGALALGAARALQRIVAPGSPGDGIATLLLTGLAGIGLWIAVAPGARVCSVGPSLRAMTPLAGVACRVPFGLGAVLTALLAGYAARRRWRARRLAATGHTRRVPDMRSQRRDQHMRALILAPAGALALVAAAHVPATPRTARIVARDYAFQAPDTLPAGDVSFELENRGAHFHELIVGRLRPGVTAGDIVAVHQRGAALRHLQNAYLAEGAGGALLAQPGTRSTARLVMPLEHGQTYVLLCQLRDSLDKPQHAVLGMFRLLHVR